MTRHTQNPANTGQLNPLAISFSRLEGLLKVLNASASLCQSGIRASNNSPYLPKHCDYLISDCERLLEAAQQMRDMIE